MVPAGHVLYLEVTPAETKCHGRRSRACSWCLPALRVQETPPSQLPCPLVTLHPTAAVELCGCPGGYPALQRPRRHLRP